MNAKPAERGSPRVETRTTTREDMLATSPTHAPWQGAKWRTTVGTS